MYTDYTEENNNNSYYNGQGNKNINKEKLKKISFLVLAFVVGLILIVVLIKGCSKDDNDDISMNPSGKAPVISLNVTTVSLQVGEGKDLTANIYYTNNKNPIVKWVSEDTSVVVVDDDGYIQAISEGKTNIIASYIENGIKYDTKCSVMVTSKVIEVENIDIAQDNFSIKKGDSILLQIDITPKDAQVGKLIYSSDDSSIATVNNVGIVNAIDTGTTTITVKTEDGSLSDSVTVNITEEEETLIEATSILMIGLTNGLSVGTKAEVVYVLNPSNATNTELTWTSSDTSIATVEDGIVTGKKAGKCTIIVSTSNNISGKLEVVVQSDKVPVENITVVGETAISMNLGGTKKINYIISPSNATNQNVSYTTSNNAVLLVDSNGMMAAVGTGTAVVTITSEDGNKTAFLNVTVRDENGNTSSSDGSEESSGDLACLPQEMIKITHNYPDKAIVSSNQFSYAKAFTSNDNGTPAIIIEDLYDNCIGNSVKAYVFYGKSESDVGYYYVRSFTGLKEGSKIELSEGNGYYKIKIDDNSDKLTKWYYAIVDIDGNTSSSEDSGSGGSSSSSSCGSNLNDDISISHNYAGTGAKIYTDTYSNAKTNSFKLTKGQIQIIIKELNTDCTGSKFNYSIHYGKSNAYTLTQVSSGSATSYINIPNKGIGYYKIVITSTKDNSLTKTYWLYVSDSGSDSSSSTDSSTPPTFTFNDKSCKGGLAVIDVTIKKGTYNMKSIKYCWSGSQQVKCVPTTDLISISDNGVVDFQGKIYSNQNIKLFLVIDIVDIKGQMYSNVFDVCGIGKNTK